MIAKYSGKCVACGHQFPSGTEIKWSRQDRTAQHLECAQSETRNADDPTLALEDHYDGLSEMEDRYERF